MTQRLLWLTIAGFTIVVPLFVEPGGEEVFRLPKELLLRAEALLATALILIAALRGDVRWQNLGKHRFVAAIVGVLVVAAAVTTAFSTNVAISVSSFAYTMCCLVVGVGAYIAAGWFTADTLLLTIIASASVNSVFAIVQRLDLWNPFKFPANLERRLRVTALIGNPNDLGAYLTICSVVLLTAATLPRRRRLAAAFAVIAIAGVIASDALTAMGATFIAGLALVFYLSRRRALAIVLIAVLCGVLAYFSTPALRERGQIITHAIQTRDLGLLTSYRIVAFNVAWQMFRDHPIVGAGPGTFKWDYLPYRMRVELLHPGYYLKSLINFGEVHSDHLQILAEEGAIGYAAFIAAVLSVASRSFVNSRRDDSTYEQEFARRLAFPLAIALSLLAVTGFPLELSSVTCILALSCGCLLRWSHS